MFCENCGTKLPDDSKFCKECGHKITYESDIKSNNESNSNISSDSEIKNENGLFIKSKSNKIFVISLIILILLFAVFLFSISNFSDNNNVNNNVNPKESLSPSFTDNIYGINFQIPEGYETLGGTDNQNKGTMVVYDRNYMGPNGSSIDISVSTAKGSFYWDLTQNREYDDVEKTINGHDGVYKSSGIFSYVVGDKLIVIRGASEQQLQSIIIE